MRAICDEFLDIPEGMPDSYASMRVLAESTTLRDYLNTSCDEVCVRLPTPGRPACPKLAYSHIVENNSQQCRTGTRARHLYYLHTRRSIEMPTIYADVLSLMCTLRCRLPFLDYSTAAY